jgi:hypothetical protein
MMKYTFKKHLKNSLKGHFECQRVENRGQKTEGEGRMRSEG